ncbi:MAG: hypothetical protein LAT52_00930, partial [Balneolales bacterium]|nr:hypothetical protein [Balneolales bacterium]
LRETSAMMACTAMSAVKTALFAGQAKTDTIGGAYVPELLVDKKAYIDFMCEHGMELNVTENTLR